MTRTFSRKFWYRFCFDPREFFRFERICPKNKTSLDLCSKPKLLKIVWNKFWYRFRVDPRKFFVYPCQNLRKRKLLKVVHNSLHILGYPEVTFFRFWGILKILGQNLGKPRLLKIVHTTFCTYWDIQKKLFSTLGYF